MIQTECKRCRKTYFMHNKFDSDCPWCEYEAREARIVMYIGIGLVAIICGALWLL